MTSPLGVRPSIPVGTLMSIFDTLFLGIDEFGTPVYLPLIYRNMLIGGEPGAGKSNLLNTIVGHAALCDDVSLCLLDGKQLELGLWEDCADVFVGPDLDLAIATLQRLQTVLNNRSAFLKSIRRQKMRPADVFGVILLAIDELAYYSATMGEKKDQEKFSALVRDLVARGRASAVLVVVARAVRGLGTSGRFTPTGGTAGEMGAVAGRASGT